MSRVELLTISYCSGPVRIASFSGSEIQKELPLCGRFLQEKKHAFTA
jgi:hypothetical protein